MMAAGYGAACCVEAGVEPGRLPWLVDLPN